MEDAKKVPGIRDSEMEETIGETMAKSGADEDTKAKAKEVAEEVVADEQEQGFFVSKEDVAEFTALEDQGEIERASAHRKKCKKENRRPIPPSKWLTCPVCGYRTPESLVNHFRTHGGVAAVAKQLHILPEQVIVINPELQKRFEQVGKNNVPKSKEQEGS